MSHDAAEWEDAAARADEAAQQWEAVAPATSPGSAPDPGTAARILRENAAEYREIASRIAAGEEAPQ